MPATHVVDTGRSERSNMRKLLKAAAVGAVVAPLVLTGASSALADGPSYLKHTAAAGSKGAASSLVFSGFHGRHGDHGQKRGMESRDGRGMGPSYKKVTKFAGPKGAWVNKTASGFHQGDAYYVHSFKGASPWGAASSTTASHS